MLQNRQHLFLQDRLLCLKRIAYEKMQEEYVKGDLSRKTSNGRTRRTLTPWHWWGKARDFGALAEDDTVKQLDRETARFRALNSQTVQQSNDQTSNVQQSNAQTVQQTSQVILPEADQPREDLIYIVPQLYMFNNPDSNPVVLYWIDEDTTGPLVLSWYFNPSNEHSGTIRATRHTVEQFRQRIEDGMFVPVVGCRSVKL